MAHIVADRVQETTTGTGNGNLTLAGAATGMRAFSAVMANNDTTLYAIKNQANSEWEVGVGTWTTGNVLVRTDAGVIGGSAGAGTRVTFTAGTKDVFITSPAVMQMWGSLTPAQIAADQNNYNPTGLQYASVLRLETDQIRNITGLAGGYDGRIISLINIGAADSLFVLKRENASSTAGNRFALPEDLPIGPGGRAILQYDGTSSRWRLLAKPAVSGASGRMCPFFSTDMLGPAGAGTMETHMIWDFAVIASGTQSKIAGEVGHPGIHRITSSTSANSGGYCMSDVTGILLAGGEAAEFVFRIIDLTTLTVRMGFHDSVTNADATDGAYIEIPSTGAAVGKTANNGTRTTSATIATLSINTWYRLRIEVADDAASVTFTIFDANGNQLGTQTNSANIPTGAGRNCGHGLVATKSGTTAQGCIETDYMSLEFNEALVR